MKDRKTSEHDQQFEALLDLSLRRENAEEAKGGAGAQIKVIDGTRLGTPQPNGAIS